MSHAFWKRAILVVLFCCLRAARAEKPDVSADDTLTYINATLHKYPTLEFVEGGCPGFEQVLMISEDRRSLIIKQNAVKSDGGKCQDLQTLIAPIFSINKDELGVWSKQGQHTSLFLDCINRVDCFTLRSDEGMFPKTENN